ncbi:MAG: hypothetical protein Q9168_001725 [Polycauliona sp. 1 TL-2023]
MSKYNKARRTGGSSHELPTPESTPGPDAGRLAADKDRRIEGKVHSSSTDSRGLPTPESTPGPDAGRLAADKVRRDGGNAQSPLFVEGSAPPLARITEDQEQAPVQSGPPPEQQVAILSNQPQQSSVQSDRSESRQGNALTTTKRGQKASVQSEESQVQQEVEEVVMGNNGGYTEEQKEIVKRVIEAYEKPDYYLVLGIQPPSSPEAIRKAYKKTAIAIHPDKCNHDDNASQNFAKVGQAYHILKNDEERSKYEQSPQKYSPPPPPQPPVSGEDFHASAFADDEIDLQPYLDRATPHIKKLFSTPGDPATLQALKEINDQMKKDLEESDDLTDFRDVRIQYETINAHAASAYTAYNRNDCTQQEKSKMHALVNDTIRKFLEKEQYPADWYKDLPVEAEDLAGGAEDTSGRVKNLRGEEENPRGKAQNRRKIAEEEGQVLTKNGERILGYSNVGRGHQFIIEVETQRGTAYELKSGAEIGFKTVGEYLNSSEENQNLLGTDDSGFSRDDARYYQGVYGVASKPRQTATVGGRSRLPTAWVLTGIGNSQYWLTRTTLRKICGKASADEDIRQWYLDMELQPVDEIPPKIEKRRVGSPGETTSTGAMTVEDLSTKVNTLEQLLLATQTMLSQLAQKPTMQPQEKISQKATSKITPTGKSTNKQ